MESQNATIIIIASLGLLLHHTNQDKNNWEFLFFHLLLSIFFFSQGAKEEVRCREDFADGLPVSLLGCARLQSPREPFHQSPGEGIRAPARLPHSAPEAEEALLSTALVELSTQCL